MIRPHVKHQTQNILTIIKVGHLTVEFVSELGFDLQIPS